MSRPILAAFSTAVMFALLAGCAQQPAAPEPIAGVDPGFPVWEGWEPRALHPEFVLESTEFEDEGEFPETIELDLKCGGPNVRPELHWSGAPEGTESFVISFTYIAPGDRWLAFNLPPDVSEVPGTPEVPDIGAVAVTSHNTTGFFGPCSLKGEKFRLWFTIYALDTTLDLESGIAAWQVGELGVGHVLAAAELAGYRTGPTE